MIVRRLCVTPAVGSVMQWLLTKRNRTTERTNRETARQQHGVQIPKGVSKMPQNTGQTELQEKTHRLLDGPLKHIRVVALAAALLPLASVAAVPAAAQTQCPSGICPPPPPPPPATPPGTGTPGYWKNHPAAWPAGGITGGGV